MPLLLRIDNVDSLPDGGPVTFELDRRGIDIGRDPYLDWTLPDPERFISGKHCELRYRDGGYWLHDVSTNGTTVNGRPGRLTEPYRLQDGDRVHIGQYIIAVELKGEDAAAPPPVATPSAGGNVWDNVPDAAAAVDRRDFAARARAEAEPSTPRGPVELPEEDISWSIGELTEGQPPSDGIWDAPPAGGRPGREDEWGWTSPAGGQGGMAPAEGDDARSSSTAERSESGAHAPAPYPEQPPDFAPPETDTGAAPAERRGPTRPTPRDPFAGSETRSTGTPAPGRAPPAPDPRPPADPFASEGPPATGPAEPARARAGPPPGDVRPAAPTGLASQWTGGAPASSVPPPSTSSTTAAEARPAQGGDFVAAFERGAGLSAGAVVNRGGDAFAEELGALFRLVTQHLQAMLLARAETKSAIRSADRTMINALENNPLKFSPTPEDAMRVMFGVKSRSYLDPRATLEASFGDLQRHQMQTFGAMQQALQALVEDLDPKSIDAGTPEEGGLAGMVSSRRAKLWDAYVERFRAKAGRHERGMVDAFMLLFAEMYDRQR